MHTLASFIHRLRPGLRIDCFTGIEGCAKIVALHKNDPILPASLLPHALAMMNYGMQFLADGSEAVIRICEENPAMDQLQRLRALAYVADFNQPLTENELAERTRVRMSSADVPLPEPDGKIAARAGHLISHMMSDVSFAVSVPGPLALEANMIMADSVGIHSQEARQALRRIVVIVNGDNALCQISEDLKWKAGRFLETRAGCLPKIQSSGREIAQRFDKNAQPPHYPSLPESTVTDLAWFRGRQAEAENRSLTLS